MSRLIYQPKGKAREYSPWACNLYNGCSNRCSYCYNRHCPGAAVPGKDEVTIKGGLSEEEAKALFNRELARYRDRIIADGKGLFFNFVSDPFLDETWKLNLQCAVHAITQGVPVVFLSKKTCNAQFFRMLVINSGMVKVGFTLTGCDNLEPGADSNLARISEMSKLHQHNVPVWASIEPIIDLPLSMLMMRRAYNAGCREFRIGLLSGKKEYTPQEVAEFKEFIDDLYGHNCEIHWKESVTKYLGKL